MNLRKLHNTPGTRVWGMLQGYVGKSWNETSDDECS